MSDLRDRSAWPRPAGRPCPPSTFSLWLGFPFLLWLNRPRTNTRKAAPLGGLGRFTRRRGSTWAAMASRPATHGAGQGARPGTRPFPGRPGWRWSTRKRRARTLPGRGPRAGPGPRARRAPPGLRELPGPWAGPLAKAGRPATDPLTAIVQRSAAIAGRPAKAGPPSRLAPDRASAVDRRVSKPRCRGLCGPEPRNSWRPPATGRPTLSRGVWSGSPPAWAPASS
jgi:hypothetical protein